MTKLGVVTLVVDAARDRGARPLKGEFFQQPRMPIREQYLYRLLVNMVWFARNYLNFVVIFVLVLAVWYPLFFLTLTCSFLVHFKKSHPIAGPGLKVAQFALCCVTPMLYGIFPPLVSGFVVMSVIFSHALLTPYTDSASALYEELTKSDESFPAPGTPVTEYTGTNKFGPHQIGSTPSSGTGAAPGSTSAGALQGMPPLQLGEPVNTGYGGGAAAGAEARNQSRQGIETTTTASTKKKKESSKGQPVQVPTAPQLPKPVAKKAGRTPFSPNAADGYMAASSLPESSGKR